MNDQLTEVYASIDALIDYALAHLDLDPRNADWTRNQIFALFRLDSYPGPKTTTSAASVSDVVQDIVGSRSQAPYGEKTPDPLLAAFRAAATTAGLFKPEEGPAYADTIMGILSANPADLDDRFLLVEHRDGGMAAMQWFYDYCVANNYVKRAQLDRNPRFDSHGLATRSARSAMRTRASPDVTSARCAPCRSRSAASHGSGSSRPTATSTSTASA